MRKIARKAKSTARAEWLKRRFQLRIMAAEAQQAVARTNRVFEAPFPRCWCSDHCAHSGGLHSYREEYVKILAAVKPKKVLEWGPGDNTSLALDIGASVVAIEQNEQWLLPPREGLQQLVLNVEDPSYTSPADHWDADLFFVDSRRRSECIRAVCANALKHDHVLCLHDAQRRRYHAALHGYRYVKFLAVGTAIASHSDKILAIG